MNPNYYNQNAQEFFDNTVAVDMSSLYQAFEAHLPKHANVVDAGCGSGRDTGYFLSQGYTVTSFDASEQMVKLASEHTGHAISHSTFIDFQLPPESQNGIWACATLLHVPQNDLEKTFAHLATWLKPNGILYCSFKYGEGEVKRGGRQFTNLTESSLKQLISGLELEVQELWVTHDLRTGRADEKWGDHPYVIPEYSFSVQVSGEPQLSSEHTEFRWCNATEASELLKYDSNRIALWELSERLKAHQMKN